MLDVSNAYMSREYYEIIRKANVTSGVIVTDFEENSPAKEAGLKVGDIIIKVDGNDIASNAYLRYYLYKHKVGDEMKLTIIRDGKEKELKITLTN